VSFHAEVQKHDQVSAASIQFASIRVVRPARRRRGFFLKLEEENTVAAGRQARRLLSEFFSWLIAPAVASLRSECADLPRKAQYCPDKQQEHPML
jgi:hypothetical protein